MTCSNLGVCNRERLDRDVSVKKKRKTFSLECSQCKNRNYKVTRSPESMSKPKVELKKYCRFCSEHVIHKEVR